MLPLEQIPGLKRYENTTRDEMQALVMDRTHTVYPHEKIYGEFCTIQGYIASPPEAVFEYMAQTENLQEWTFSIRNMRSTETEGLYLADEKVVDEETVIYCRTESNREAMTVDYYCAWDQPKELWMIYLNRIVDARRVLRKAGSVLIWSNCHHPYYDNNPYPETAPANRELWVGDLWPLFFGGHYTEFENLKKILEARFPASEAY